VTTQGRPCPGGCGDTLSGNRDSSKIACEACWFRLPWKLRRAFIDAKGCGRSVGGVANISVVMPEIESWWKANPPPRREVREPLWKRKPR